MNIPRIIPCLLNKGSSLVKTIKYKEVNYIGDPVNTVQIFNNLEVDELIFLDITATSEKRRPPFEMISKITGECFMPLAYGGGIRSIEDMRTIFGLGVEKVVICTQAIQNPELIKEASRLFGSQSIVVSIDVNKNILGRYKVYTNSGKKATNKDPLDIAVLMKEMGAGEIILNSIDRDGTMIGYDLELIKRISSAVSIPLIACGGAGKTEDLAKAIRAGASAAAAGSLFVYQGINRSVLINFPSRDELREVFYI